jgi:hypothetical protein
LLTVLFPRSDCIFGSVTALSATFVIDISGSMSTVFTLEGKQYTRLSYVKEHLSQVIGEQLKPYQQFNVIVFSDRAGSLFRAPVNATTANIKVCLATILVSTILLCTESSHV